MAFLAWFGRGLVMLFIVGLTWNGLKQLAKVPHSGNKTFDGLQAAILLGLAYFLLRVFILAKFVALFVPD